MTGARRRSGMLDDGADMRDSDGLDAGGAGGWACSGQGLGPADCQPINEHLHKHARTHSHFPLLT